MFSGKRLKELRISKGLTQAALAKKIGVSRVEITNYEMGNRVPSLENFEKILNFFEAKPNYLLLREAYLYQDYGFPIKMVCSMEEFELLRKLRNNKKLHDKLINALKFKA